MDELVFHKKAIEILLNKEGGYEIVFELLQGDMTQSELAEETGLAPSTTNDWLKSANRVGLVSHYSETVADDSKGVASVQWRLNKNQIPPELAEIIRKRTKKTEESVQRKNYANVSGRRSFMDELGFNEALYGYEEVKVIVKTI
jgi:transcription initiation factor IIE alpha subunit